MFVLGAGEVLQQRKINVLSSEPDTVTMVTRAKHKTARRQVTLRVSVACLLISSYVFEIKSHFFEMEDNSSHRGS